MSQAAWFLERCPLFTPLTRHQISCLSRQCAIRDCVLGSRVCSTGENVDAVFLLGSGRAKRSHITEPGKESILEFIEPGQVFGELLLFTPEFQNDDVEAVQDSTILAIRADAVRQLLRDDHQLLLRLTQMISVRRQQAERRIKSLLVRSLRYRLAQLLADLAAQYGTITDDGVVVHRHLSHQELAGQIGAARESVTIAMGQLQSEGIISFSRHALVIHKPDKLA